MRQSALFTKTRREGPKDEVAKNAELLTRAGFVHKEMAGVYSFLPLGLRTIKKIEGVIRREMEALGGQEIYMPALQPKENWEKTGRWESMTDLYKLTDEREREYALGPTHEEVVVPLVKNFVFSYQDFPFSVYQFQTKFRRELRAKSGLLRGREFLMKDLYSFHKSEAELNEFYERVISAYKNIFEAAGLGDKTYLTYASGGTFTEFSHEFQTLTEAGEDEIHLCDSCPVAVNDEIFEKQPNCPSCAGKLKPAQKAIEVGNIFKLMTKFSDPFDLKYQDNQGKVLPVIMGTYGLGLGRLMGTVAEVLSDEGGLVWPEPIAPYRVHLVEVINHSGKVRNKAEEIYRQLQEQNVEVLWDDREVSAGEKFANADLIGLPWRLVVSEKTLAAGKFELKNRRSGEVKFLPESKIAVTVSQNV